MDKTSATRLIQETFESSFNKEQFVYFIKNLLNHIEDAPFVYRGNIIPDAYDPYIYTLERIGKYKDIGGNKIDILVVQLKKETSLERARTMQRNFIAWYLNGSRGGKLKDAALVGFVSPNSEDWRFSLVKMDYRIDTSNERVKVKQELTPARRFSFLVGKNESSHTAQSCLVPILEDDIHDPIFKELEEAFSIEKVTKEFFKKYCALFLWIKEELDEVVNNNLKIKTDFTQKGVITVDFAKKFLGQIVFLYFLQRKGWFGVARNTDWGTGPKNFLRLLFEKKIIDYDNFFNDILEPLFYEALAIERTEDFYSRFNCKIPFLNGGLFDPINNYDWVYTDILLPNELFSNDTKTKEGDIGTGILDVFDRYNFTVKEDEPLEKEVAVDPEMLGKVFENLLEVKDRKSKGTYYTPREIVHYMCQESLINYLAAECEEKVSKEDIEILVHYGELAVEHDSRVEKEGRETDTYSYKLPESIRENAKLIDKKLKNIRVCDPAIGSGAFPVGMMSEIVRKRNILTNYIKDKKDRTIYKFKHYAIQNCLYGVDIDPGAVEIAKLRLWLSLVVDEEDIRQIKPLPNLDYKIMQGNSLLEEFEGIKLFDERLLNIPIKSTEREKRFKELRSREGGISKELLACYQKHPEWMKNKNIKKPIKLYQLEKELNQIKYSIRYEMGLDESLQTIQEQKIMSFGEKVTSDIIWKELKSLHNELFETSQKSKKDEIRERIERLEWQLIETTLKEQGKQDKLSKLEQYKRNNIRPFFLWKLHFAEVFKEKGGFDVVIANPPYISSWHMGKEYKNVYLRKFKSTTGHYDLYILFFEEAVNILKRKGILYFITSNKYLSQNYGRGIRNLFLNNQLLSIVNFNFQVFEATVDTCITGVSKNFGNNNAIKLLEISEKDLSSQGLEKILADESSFTKVKQHGFGLLEDKNFRFNVLNIDLEILKTIKRQSILLDKILYVDTGVVVHSSKKNLKKEYFIKEFPFRSYKKFLEGKNIFRWLTKGYSYLDYQPKLHHRSKMKELFEREKIIMRRVVGNKGVYATYDSGDYYVENGVILFTLICNLVDLKYKQLNKYLTEEKINLSKNFNLKYVLAIVNSQLTIWFFKKFYFDGLHIYPQHIRWFFAKQISPEAQRPFTSLIDKILIITKSDDYLENPDKQAKVKEYERQIDEMVYELYGLTEEEIKIVEGG